MRENFLSEEEIEAMRSGKTEIDFQKEGGFAERSWSEYEDVFDLKVDECKGKTILDVGPSFHFQREAKEKGVDVIAVDPSQRREVKAEDKFVKGSAQFLPFKTNSVDKVLAFFSVPAHIDKNDDAEALLSIYEMLRVAKSGGEVRIFPFTPREIFEKEGIYNLNDPARFPEAKRFKGFNLKELLDQGQIPYEIRDIKSIDKNISHNPNIATGWEKAVQQFIVMQKIDKSNLEPMQQKIEELLKKRLSK